LFVVFEPGDEGAQVVGHGVIVGAGGGARGRGSRSR
jgi:hypothetical protein